MPSPSTVPGPQFSKEIWDKYHCLTFEKLLTIIPPCADYCESIAIGNGADGCQPDDFVCHCQHSQRISDLIEPCIFPFINHTSACTVADLAPLQSFVTESCTFYNATGYADYRWCGPKVTYEIIKDLVTGASHW